VALQRSRTSVSVAQLYAGTELCDINPRRTLNKIYKRVAAFFAKNRGTHFIK
jgi:hypothetical protein